MAQKVHRLIDSHSHLEELEDLEIALEKARGLGVAAVIAVGSSYRSNVQTLEISERHPGFVYPALAIPTKAGNFTCFHCAFWIQRPTSFIRSKL